MEGEVGGVWVAGRGGGVEVGDVDGWSEMVRSRMLMDHLIVWLHCTYHACIIGSSCPLRPSFPPSLGL